jgi:lipid II:glycine glycyltransferase (peptidoglycan interpeptide bridge formation enzyme)
VEEVNSQMDLEQACALLSKTYQAAHVPLADSSLFESAYELLLPKGMCMVTIARVGNAPAATSFELLYKDVIYGWYGGMDREYGSYVPNELLMWSILCWGSEQGFHRYDFGGAGKPSEEYGVRDFKAKFGGELVCYGRNTWVPHSFLMRFCKTGYQVLRRRL